jgi:poly-gamma-glutamate capsule biosynthesis protein CapA/YwtB (metallophosphatase superfamily)
MTMGRRGSMGRHGRTVAVLLGVGLCVSASGCAGGTVRDPATSGKEGASHKPGGGGTGGGSTDATKPAGHHWLTIAAVGDTMLGNTPELPPEPASYLDQVKSDLKGDFVFGNLEGTLTEVTESPKCPEGSESGDCYAFHAPPEFAKYLHQAGFTVMNDANNHSYDYGQLGEEETVESLYGAGIVQTGLPEEITFLRSGGEKVAFLGFAPYSNTASLTDLPTAQTLIEKASHEAEVVVVAIHAGAEGTEAQHVTGEEETYLGEDRGNPEAFAHMAIDAGADLILGSGPHVLRGMEIYKERLIAYSLGNFCGFHNFATEGVLGQSAILHVKLSPDGAFHSGHLTPIALAEAGQPTPDPTDAGPELISTLSEEDFGPSAVKIVHDQIHAG